MAEYIPMRKPGKLTLQEAEEKLEEDGKSHQGWELLELTGMTEDEEFDEAMRAGGWTDEDIRQFRESFGM